MSEQKKKRGNPKWKKGAKSPNPGGRPKIAAEVKALAGKHSLEAIRVLVELMHEAGDEKTRKAAADSVLDRAIGRPTQAIANDPENPMPQAVTIYIPDNGR